MKKRRFDLLVFDCDEVRQIQRSTDCFVSRSAAIIVILPLMQNLQRWLRFKPFDVKKNNNLTRFWPQKVP